MICDEKNIVMWQHCTAMDLIIDRAAIVKLLRTQKNLSQHELGVNKGTVNLLEKRKRKTDEDSLNKIAKRLDTTLRQIDDYVEILSGRLRSAQSMDVDALCSHKTHSKLQAMLDEMLHEPETDESDYAGWISGNVVNLYAGMKNIAPDLALVVHGKPQNFPRGTGKAKLIIKDIPPNRK